MPTHNRLDYLERAVGTVVKQTFSDLELIVVDDASVDDVRALLDTFNDQRIRYLRNERNLGMAATNICGYQAANGRYFAHLDDDDEWTPRFLEVMVIALDQNPECTLAFSNHWVVDANGTVNKGLTARGEAVWGRDQLTEGVHKPFIEIAIVHRSIPTSHTSVMRANAVPLESLTPDAGYGWDLWLNYLVARSGGAAYFTPERLTRYRIHGTQSSGGATELRSYEALAFCDRRFLADPALRAHRAYLARRLATTSSYWAVALLAAGRPKRARQVLRAGIRARSTPLALLASALAFLPGWLSLPIAKAARNAASRHRIARYKADARAVYER